MTARQATLKTLRATIAVALAFLVALSSLPAPALAEMAEEAMGEESVAAQATGRDEAGDKGTAPGDAGLAPMAEEGAADAPADAELAVEGLAAQDSMVPDEPVAAEAPAEEAEEGEPGLSVQSVGQLYNPRVVEKSSMNSGQVATWDCVWFGSYPQTEVPETSALWTASWKDGDATVDGVRYRRILKDDAYYDVFNSRNWGNVSGYRYFRYEPIKWRILKVSGDTAFAVADKALDFRPYDREFADVTWETSTVRSWLNGTGDVPYYYTGAQSGRTAQSFAEVAFTSDQLGAVWQSSVVNEDNTYYGTPGGNDTTDRVFLLSESEVHGASATALGFASGTGRDEARECERTDYARAMGASNGWWLRSPGYSAGTAVGVDHDGSVSRRGRYIDHDHDAVRPALNLNLSSPHLTWAGTVSSDGTVDANARPGGSAKPFPDVPADSWCSGVVFRVATLKLMRGYDNGNFGPNDPITRGQVAVVLWNMAGAPAAGPGAKYFPDVMSNDYYYKAVSWASAAGVVSGYSNGNFGPKDNVTREQLAAMLASYAKQVKGKAVSGSKSDFASMADRDKVSSWAVPSVGWCFKNQILSGSGGNVNPGGNATRAEAAKMVVGLYDLLA